jgi:hypothetical protein
MRVKKTMSREGRSFASVREKKEFASFKKKKQKEEEALLSFNAHASFDCATTLARARARAAAGNQSKKKGVPEEDQEEDVVVVVGDDEWLSFSLSLSH